MTTQARHRAMPTLVLSAALFGATARDARATTRCVNQGGTGGCFGTISAALAASTDGDTIQIAGAASPYLERFTIAHSLTLVGQSAATTVIDGSFGGQVIRINDGLTVTLSNLTIRNGRGGQGNIQSEWGAGIHMGTATVTLNDCVVTGNATGGGNYCCGGYGGGIALFGGSLTLNGTVVSGNATASPLDNPLPNGVGGPGGFGGGIYHSGGSLTLNRSTVKDNTTGDGSSGGAIGGLGGQGGSGAGIFSAGGQLVLNESTVSGNTTGTGGMGADHGNSGSGAGIACSCTLTLSSSTVSGNVTGKSLDTSTGGKGGGIYHDAPGPSAISNSTVAFNQCDADQSSGGIANANGTVTLKNSLFAWNRTQASPNSIHDCSGTLTSQGYNLMSVPFCTISPTTGDQLFVGGTILLPLADNGGPTKTHALAGDSPAREASDNSTCPPADQRGVHRPIGERCDIGAFEVEPIGDANGDGLVNVADVLYLINHLFAGGPRPLGRANVNGDGAINVGDILYLINHLFAGGPAPG